MVKKKIVKKKVSNGKVSKTKVVKNPSKDTIKHVAVITPNENDYKKGLLEVDKQEEKYDKLFEQKLAEQYKEFRNLKEHHMQSKRFFQILLTIIVVILIALLLLSFR
jgi:hypothetical protein